MCLIPQRSCSHAREDSCRLIFLWTVANLTHGNLDEITCKTKTNVGCMHVALYSVSVWIFFFLNDGLYQIWSHFFQLLDEAKMRRLWFWGSRYMEEQFVTRAKRVQTEDEGHIIMQKTGFCIMEGHQCWQIVNLLASQPSKVKTPVSSVIPSSMFWLLAHLTGHGKNCSNIQELVSELNALIQTKGYERIYEFPGRRRLCSHSPYSFQITFFCCSALSPIW